VQPPEKATQVRFVLPKSPFALEGKLTVPIEIAPDNR